MARIRTIKPDFFSSLTVGDLSRDARLTFVGLWTHCDDEGRCVADERLVKAAIWPLDDDITTREVGLHLSDLGQAGLIHIYWVRDRRYIQVVNWKEHQAINKPRPSKLPSFDDADEPPRHGPPDNDRSATGALPEDSHGERKGKEGKGTAPSTSVDTPQADESFEEFWQAYPARNGRRLYRSKALGFWARLSLPDRREAYRGARNYCAAYEARLPGVGAMDPHRFLRDRVWEGWQERAQARSDSRHALLNGEVFPH